MYAKPELLVVGDAKVIVLGSFELPEQDHDEVTREVILDPPYTEIE